MKKTLNYKKEDLKGYTKCKKHGIYFKTQNNSKNIHDCVRCYVEEKEKTKEKLF